MSDNAAVTRALNAARARTCFDPSVRSPDRLGSRAPLQAHFWIGKDLKRTAVIRPSTTMNRNTPCGLTADTRLSPNRLPVAGTTGVWPIGAHVVPE